MCSVAFGYFHWLVNLILEEVLDVCLGAMYDPERDDCKELSVLYMPAAECGKQMTETSCKVSRIDRSLSFLSYPPPVLTIPNQSLEACTARRVTPELIQHAF